MLNPFKYGDRVKILAESRAGQTGSIVSQHATIRGDYVVEVDGVVMLRYGAAELEALPQQDDPKAVANITTPLGCSIDLFDAPAVEAAPTLDDDQYMLLRLSTTDGRWAEVLLSHTNAAELIAGMAEIITRD